jgi:hypothetical protein
MEKFCILISNLKKLYSNVPCKTVIDKSSENNIKQDDLVKQLDDPIYNLIL